MNQKSPSLIDKYVASRVRLRRLQLGISQEGLASILGLTFQQIQKYEKGANRISAGRLQNIAHALSVPLHFFYEGLPEDDASVGHEETLRLSQAMASPEIASLLQAVANLQNPRITLILRDLAVAITEEIYGKEKSLEGSQTSISPR
jgi:transcriptional regulator with XRE-family HTH domain